MGAFEKSRWAGLLIFAVFSAAPSALAQDASADPCAAPRRQQEATPSAPAALQAAQAPLQLSLQDQLRASLKEQNERSWREFKARKMVRIGGNFITYWIDESARGCSDQPKPVLVDRSDAGFAAAWAEIERDVRARKGRGRADERPDEDRQRLQSGEFWAALRDQVAPSCLCQEVTWNRGGGRFSSGVDFSECRWVGRFEGEYFSVEGSIARKEERVGNERLWNALIAHVNSGSDSVLPDAERPKPRTFYTRSKIHHLVFARGRGGRWEAELLYFKDDKTPGLGMVYRF